MNLGEFKKHIESFPNGHVFNYGISEPFSWRGVYAEVAFSIVKKETSREDIVAKIEAALTDEFEGWKGGKYRYNEYTSVNFEETQRNWSDGEYCQWAISEITKEDVCRTQEERLVKLAFK